ncbi:MAG TPA: hypothetical protein VE687_17555, partial [Stellaceae bacterium]|nr:hypothetical protein [Stellaceae bacterium]
DALLLFERGVHDLVTEPVRCNGLDDPKIAAAFAESGTLPIIFENRARRRFRRRSRWSMTLRRPESWD